jgi:hypothetical protein
MTALGFPLAEDGTRWEMRRFLTLSLLLVIGSSAVFMGAASLMKVKETSTGRAPVVSSPSDHLSRDVGLSRLFPIVLINA